MNKNELINKYVDRELTTDEVEEINDLITVDKEFKKLISTHKFVHQTLSQIPIKLAPHGFTDLVMKNIVNRISEKYKKNYFFRFALASFGIILVVTLFFFFYYLSDLGVVQNTYQSANNYTNKFLPIFSRITDFIKTDIFKILTGMVSFIILVGFYFNINMHNSFKNRIKQY